MATINPALPTNILAPGGLNTGDLVLFIVSTAGNGTGTQGTSSVQTATAVGEITGIPDSDGSTLNLPTAMPLISTRRAPTVLLR